MKITIEVPDTHIDGALESPHSRYWATEAVWDRTTKRGHVIESMDSRGNGGRHVLNAKRVKIALRMMLDLQPKQFARLASGDYDGETGDLFLQLIALGEIKYG